MRTVVRLYDTSRSGAVMDLITYGEVEAGGGYGLTVPSSGASMEYIPFDHAGASVVVGRGGEGVQVNSGDLQRVGA